MAESPSSVSADETFVEQDCAKCKQLAEQLDRVRADVEGLNNQNVANLRVIGQLRHELAQHTEEEPEGPDVKRLLLLWRDEVMAGSTRVSLRLDGPRGQRVRWALKRYKPERLEHAILGALHDDWAMGRDRRTRGRAFNDIAKHIFKDEETIERFELLYLQGGKQRSDTPAIDRVLGKLEKVRQTKPGQWEACCPAHDDKVASLSIAQGRKGVVAHCNVGCAVNQIAAAIDEDLTEWFDSTPSTEQPVKRIEPLTSEIELEGFAGRLLTNDRLIDRLHELRGWTKPALEQLGVGFDGQRLLLPIRDGQGTLVNVLRYKPASLKEGERKMLSLTGRPRELFPAPETLEGDVWLVEGEPDAITGLAVGLPVSGVPGSNGWRGEWSERLADRRVVICFDCDQPGRNAAGKVALSVAKVAKDVRVVDLDRERNDGFDLTDFLKTGRTVDELKAMAEMAGSVVAHRRAA